MRLWSINFKYLDAKGLVALWREGLLARKVLMGETKGYKNHPQLIRFKNLENSVDGINQYLHCVVDEADRRGYNFDRDKLDQVENTQSINVTSGQIEYEKTHLMNKLRERDYNRFLAFREETKIEVAKMFKVIEGNIESWEIIK